MSVAQQTVFSVVISCGGDRGGTCVDVFSKKKEAEYYLFTMLQRVILEWYHCTDRRENMDRLLAEEYVTKDGKSILSKYRSVDELRNMMMMCDIPFIMHGSPVLNYSVRTCVVDQMVVKQPAKKKRRK